MTILLRTTLTSVVLTGCLTALLSAQHRSINPHLRETPRDVRDGFWISFGVGAGRESFRFFDDPAGYSPEVTGPTFYLKMGGTPSQHWTLGGEAFAWRDDYVNGNEMLSSLMLIAQWYPSTESGLFLKGGAGLAYSYIEDTSAPGYVIADKEGGLAGVLGAGYEIRIGRNVSLAPTIDVHLQSYGRSNVNERVVNLGLGVTFH